MHTTGRCFVFLVALLATVSSCSRGPKPHKNIDMAPIPGGWTSVEMVDARQDHTATRLANGHVLIAGAREKKGDPRTTSTEIYDPTKRRCTRGTKMPDSNTGALRLEDDSVLFSGPSYFLASPDGMTFTEAGKSDFRRFGLTMVQLADGKVLVAGGGSGNARDKEGNSHIAELYDRIEHTFTRVGDMIVRRFSAPGTQLDDGRVLFSGGTGAARENYNDRLADAELYDPETRTFNKTGSMVRTRGLHTSTLLEDGRVLVTGGINEDEGLGPRRRPPVGRSPT